MTDKISTGTPEICAMCERENDATLWAHTRGEHVSPACRTEQDPIITARRAQIESTR